MLQRLNPATLRPVPEPLAGIYAHSTALEHPQKLVAMSGQIGVAPDGTTAADFTGQCHQAMEYVERLLDAHGLGLSDMLRVTYYLTQQADLPALRDIREARWHAAAPPAVTVLVVAGLASPDLLVEIEVLAGR